MNDCFPKRIKRLLLISVALLSAGCAATRPTVELPDLSDWEMRQAVLADFDDWAFRGRVGIRTEDDGFNARLRWTQDGENFDAQVSGPLGIGTVRLAGSGSAVTLTDKDGVSTRLEDAEPELYLRYGWTIPVSALPYWALGIPDPGRPAETEIDESGRLMRLSQGGWDVVVGRYTEGGGQSLPGRITATSQSTRVRIVIDDWQFFE